MKLTSFLHLSDLHITDNRGDLRRGVDTFKKLDELLNYIQKLQLEPAFTVITGDLSHTGSSQSYKHIEEYISQIQEFGGQVLPVVGNNDNRSIFSKAILGRDSQLNESPCYYSRTIEGLHVIVMDSGESTMGSFDKGQLDWLKTELQEHRATPSVIAFHHPVYLFGEFGIFNKIDAIRFKEIISTGNVLAVLNGHTHFPSYCIDEGVSYIQAGSTLETRYHTGTKKAVAYDASSFNLLGYRKDHLNSLMISPLYFVEGQELGNFT